MTLADIKLNKTFQITALPENGTLTAQLLEQGFTPFSKISLAHKAPFNGPLAFRLHNTKISIQRVVAAMIKVDEI